jgi:hypothetical protein
LTLYWPRRLVGTGCIDLKLISNPTMMPLVRWFNDVDFGSKDFRHDI